jgi:hypothetical protein
LVFLVIVLLAWSGPKINLRLFGAAPRYGTVLHACAAENRRDGTLDIGPDFLHWTPWRRNAATMDPLDVDFSHIQAATLLRRSGIPASCRLELRLADGTARNLTVFAPTDNVEAALSTPPESRPLQR